MAHVMSSASVGEAGPGRQAVSECSLHGGVRVSEIERYLNKLIDGLAVQGTGRFNRAWSVAWLLVGLAVAAVGVAYLAAAGRLGWQFPAQACTQFLSPSCSRIAGPPLRNTMGAATAAAAGAALLLGRWLAVRYAGLASARRGFALAVGLVLGLVAFGFGMSGKIPAVPVGTFGWVPILLPGSTWFVGATALIECLAAAVSHTDPRPRRLRTSY